MPEKILKRVTPDSKGRITLGKLAINVSSYIVKAGENGQLILTPYVEIPMRESWLFENKEALESVKEGIADAAAGKIVRRERKRL